MIHMVEILSAVRIFLAMKGQSVFAFRLSPQSEVEANNSPRTRQSSTSGIVR